MTIAQARTVLGLSENFSLDQLKSHYRKKVLIAHPDRNGGEEKKFLLVQQAFELLENYKENTTVYNQTGKKRHPNPSDVYEKRRQAEQAYKEKVHYTYQNKYRVRKEENSFVEFKTNMRYFAFTVLMLIGFFILLLIAMAFGAFGVIFLLIISAVTIFRVNFKKFKL
ncbi:MAG: DnaJ domain-containing protein [Chitinophagales bacterium]|jgi:curved DNA-binding protein CbpA|nr:DnaJ domain-containing protein [Sphingobacteriales bacterium]